MPKLTREIAKLKSFDAVTHYRDNYQAPADNGFFGPDSVAWRVWGYPSSVVIGFTRAVTIEQLDPNLNAAVEGTGDVRYRTRTRYERTMRYFALAAFGDTATATKAADVLVKVHSKAIGTDPVTGGHYDANDPASQLWIHVTAWHSILYSYELFGGGKLTEAEELQYWAECARAAELQTITVEDVPRSREEVRAFFESWRPKIAASEMAQDMTDFILESKFVLPADMPRWSHPVRDLITGVLRRAVISTYPPYIRKMFGLSQSKLVDGILQVSLRTLLRAVYSNKALFMRIAEYMVPTTVPVAAHAILGIPAQSEVTMTPREAQARYGYDIPAEAHKELRAKQEKRVFGEGLAPSDEGLIESEQFIGTRAG